ncbi:lysophospholipid acyltransferase family protein [Hyphobacterium sp. HN65]|uniref:Lysophospholipid acyltransferase family protein n=1 Tax=Hyphobacterium lacteum TaxID=3116575 RepID=A0ABU7LN57_9PROT|nr:lysophospholipid acyltransferase family protein [Hyphobacterium sp. HN65]MEE2525351.1 lysophospholipid acyltransferase family protein [Hyphobacterium sp. HN65]
MSANILQHIGWRLEALAWDMFQGSFQAMGLERGSAFGSAALRRIGPLTPVHNVARINMQRCFPNASEPEINRLLDRMWDNFGRLVGENANMRDYRPEVYDERGEIAGEDIVLDLEKQGQPYVLVAGHFANWEVMGAAIAKLNLNCNITYRHANNPLVDKRILDSRHAYGIKLLTAKGGVGAKQLLANLREGMSVALMNDQKMNDGIAAPFFGYEAMTASGPAKMAMRFGAPIVPIGVRRLGGTRFRVTFYEPIPHSKLEDKSAALLETVTLINQWVEARILEAPEQWFWVHRRWDKSIYRKEAGSS